MPESKTIYLPQQTVRRGVAGYKGGPNVKIVETDLSRAADRQRAADAAKKGTSGSRSRTSKPKDADSGDQGGDQGNGGDGDNA